MAYRVNNKSDTDLLELLLNKGLEGLPEVLTQFINQAMELERQRYLRAKPYERREKQTTYANDYKRKQLKSRVGKLQLQIPQTRDSKFYPNVTNYVDRLLLRF